MGFFTNPDENRIRAGWRILFHLSIFLLLLGIVRFLLFDHLLYSVRYISIGVIALGTVWFCARYTDFRDLKSFGIDTSFLWWKEVAYGFFMGGMIMTGIYLFFRIMGWVEITGYGWEREHFTPYAFALFGYFVAMCSVGFYEELIFRGYQTRNIAEGLRTPSISNNQAAILAVLVTSVIFGLLHYGNPNATILSTLIITAAGVMFGLPYIITGRLSIPIGLHISWNFFQGGIFGMPVSGIPTRVSLLQTRIEGPLQWTGGRFGPEASMTGLIAVVLLTIWIILYLRRTGHQPKAIAGFTKPPVQSAKETTNLMNS